jgi:hypothetical protein
MSDAEVLSQILDYSTHLKQYHTKKSSEEPGGIIRPAVHRIEDKKLETLG